MDVSVIVSTRNRAVHLRETLRSLAATRVPPSLECELVVVDNGSTDETASVVETYAPAEWPVRRVLEPIPGLSRARNRGVRETNGTVVLFTDDDVRVPTEWVGPMVALILEDEEHPLRPISPYGITKLTTEKYLHFYRHQYGIESIVLRYANVYGPRQNAHGDAGVVAIFTQQMLDGRQPIINGTGFQTRDYVFVGDVVRANLAALYGASGVFNVGTGKETSVNYLFRLIRVEAGSAAAMTHGPDTPGEQRRSVLGYERAEQELGWSPTVSVQEGLVRTVRWFREQRQPAMA